MKPQTTIISIAATVILSGCSLFQSVMPGTTLSDANVLAMLNVINLSEIDSADLAKEKSSSAEIRIFASQMLNEHTAMLQESRQLAQQINVDDSQMPALALTVGKRHQEMMEELRSLSGANFDQAYLKYQIQMHKQAIDLVQHTADSAGDFRLQYHLEQLLQDLMIHSSLATAVERQVVARY